jgi:hypothetical protein
MRNTTRVRLFLLLVLVGALAGVFATPAGQVASAAPLCEWCDNKYDACLARTCCTQCNGSDPCCANLVANCWANCI